MYFLSLFSSQPFFLIQQLVFQIHLYTYVLCVCAVCYTEGRDIPTLSRMWFSTKKTPFIERFFASKNSFSLTASGTRIISFLYPIREASSVLRKSKLFPLERAVLSQKPAPRCCCDTSIPLWIIVCRWFNKSLKPIASIGPLLVSCLILYCRSPNPLHLLRSNSASIFRFEGFGGSKIEKFHRLRS